MRDRALSGLNYSYAERESDADRERDRDRFDTRVVVDSEADGA